MAEGSCLLSSCGGNSTPGGFESRPLRLRGLEVKVAKKKIIKSNQAVLIFITTASEKEAERIAKALLTQKKAACVSILPRVNSFFWWQGKIDSASEVLLVVKTESRLLEAIVKLVKKLHSYEIPEIIAMPIIGGNEEYLKWISGSLKNKL